MRKTPPCKGCFDRTVTCHGFCQKYKQWRAEQDEENRKREEAKQKENDSYNTRAVRMAIKGRK